MSNPNRNRWFSVLYRTRIKVNKGDIPILNLSLIFSLLAVGSAPWLAVTGVLIALALGYQFHVERDAPEFSGDFDAVMNDAASNVKSVVDKVTEKKEEG